MGRKSIRDKNVAAVLALVFGWAGVHRFYLGQIGLGILYLFLMGTGLSFMLGLIDAVAFFVMDRENFDSKYNAHRARSYYRPRSSRYHTRSSRPTARRVQKRTADVRANKNAGKVRQLIKEGKEAFKSFDYEEAVEHFNKALKLDEKNPAVHFNLACLYSLEENKEKALAHLHKAVAFGFKDFDRIEKHEALAWLRTQDEFEAFRQNKYRLKSSPASRKKIEVKSEEDRQEPDLLEQLNRLKQLRERGMLTEKEYRRELEKLKR